MSLTVDYLAQQTGMTLKRAERALADLKAAGLVTIAQARKPLPDGAWKGLAAVNERWPERSGSGKDKAGYGSKKEVQMNKKVPFRTTESLEQDSALLLKEYKDARGLVLKPPIPIEDIIEKHLELTIEFDDTHDIYKVPIPPNGERIILGSIDHEGHVIIDESLDPEDNPNQLGRYRFTLAHEGGGHWQLHQILLNEKVMQRSLFDNPSQPTARTIICRSTKKKPPHEWQADFYAACLLMPREMIKAAWQERFPDREMPQGNSLAPPKIEHQSVVVFPDRLEEREEMACNRLCKPLADLFEVSLEAMRIRLQALSLLSHVTLQQQSFRFQQRKNSITTNQT